VIADRRSPIADQCVNAPVVDDDATLPFRHPSIPTTHMCTSSSITPGPPRRSSDRPRAGPAAKGPVPGPSCRGAPRRDAGRPRIVPAPVLAAVGPPQEGCPSAAVAAPGEDGGRVPVAVALQHGGHRPGWRQPVGIHDGASGHGVKHRRDVVPVRAAGVIWMLDHRETIMCSTRTVYVRGSPGSGAASPLASRPRQAGRSPILQRLEASARIASAATYQPP